MIESPIPGLIATAPVLEAAGFVPHGEAPNCWVRGDLLAMAYPALGRFNVYSVKPGPAAEIGGFDVRTAEEAVELAAALDAFPGMVETLVSDARRMVADASGLSIPEAEMTPHRINDLTGAARYLLQSVIRESLRTGR
jgi:hypothetical protein